MALNGLIGAGVPQDWAAHRVGYELTVLYGLDHAQTLAVLVPAIEGCIDCIFEKT